MSAPVSDPIAIGSLDLAALLCSRVCHDLISPVGAIVNGIEVMEEDKNEETKTFALELIKKSAYQASAKLQFCRLAFGAAGSAGAQIDLGDAEKLARGLFDDGKTALTWNLPRLLLDKNRVKLLLNMLVIAAGTVSRGGTLPGSPGCLSNGSSVASRRSSAFAQVRLPASSPLRRLRAMSARWALSLSASPPASSAIGASPG
jgi:histidine phosphotransferase ChpT